MFIDNVKLDLFKCFLITRELVEKVPPHGIHVGLANFLRELWVVFMQEAIQVFVSNEMLLLYDLSIDIR